MPGPSLGRQAVLNAYWIPLNFQNAALLTIAVPAIVRGFAGVDHIAEIALLATIVAVISMVVPPVAGEISDRLHRAGSPRRGTILAGAAVNAAALLWMAWAREPTAFAFAVVVATIGQNVSAAAYSALIPEVVAREHWGAASGYQGVGTLVGSIAGLAVAGLTSPAMTLIVAAAFVVAGSCTIFFTPEGRYIEGGHAQVSDVPNFAIAFASRFWTNFGLALLNTYILFFFADVLKVQNASSGTALAAVMTMVGAIVSSILMGGVSDRVPRKFVVAAAGVPMALAVIGFALVPQLRWIYVLAALFGFGYGALVSTGWALAIDSVPEIGNVARYLGIWGIAFNLPAVFAPQVGKWILSAYAIPLEGYRTLFIFSGLTFLLGSVVVLFTKRQRDSVALPWHGFGLQAFAMAVIHPYYLNAYRIRKWGRLPLRRGSTLLISNHQHDLDTTGAIMRISVQGPWHRPIFAVSSRRVMEPGFMAWRIPWLEPVMRHVSNATLFRLIGILPIENELRRRSVAAIAWEVYQRHGDLRFREVFSEAASAGIHLDDDVRLTSIFKNQSFRTLKDTNVSLASVREPYQSELVAQTRRNIEEDLPRIASVLRAGGTLYLTPEGRYTKNGRLSRFRYALDLLAPLAERIYVLAVSYDPFAGKRLSMLFRVLPARDRADLRSSLAAERPVTVSQLLARFFLAHDDAFTEPAAIAAVRDALAALPLDAFVDPELAADPARMVRASLAYLTSTGVLERGDDGYSLGAQRKDTRFPDVADIVAHQANFLEETLAGLGVFAARAAGRPGREQAST